MKVCKRGGVVKSVSEFYSNRVNKSGFQQPCKECKKAALITRYQTDAAFRAHCIRKATENPSYKKNPRKAKDGALRRKFGLTLEQYEQMLIDQSSGCAICKRPDKSGKMLAVDHCHRTGRIRGLLCDNCNKGIGCLEDNAERLESAARYIRSH